MILEFSNKLSNSILGMTDDIKMEENNFSIQSGIVRILGNRNAETVRCYIDGVKIDLKPNQIATVTFQHHLNFETQTLPLTAFIFNREFYCLFNHDSEV